MKRKEMIYVRVYIRTLLLLIRQGWVHKSINQPSYHIHMFIKAFTRKKHKFFSHEQIYSGGAIAPSARPPP
jgi:hypothetical protein